MNFTDCFNERDAILMEGGIGERLKREYTIYPDKNVALASNIYNEASRKALAEIFSQYIKVAQTYDFPLMLTTPTRRANKTNVSKSDFDENIIFDNVRFLRELKDEYSANAYIGGLMGCRGDAYKATEVLSIEEAEEFHSWQTKLFQNEGVDFLFAGIMPALSEAIGMAKAMENTGIPYIISFMLRDNGKLIDGTTIQDAIKSIEEATLRKPLCYMTNCVHPRILSKALSFPFNRTELVRTRFLGIQANSSPLSPEELDQCCELKTSDSTILADEMMKLHQQYPLKIFGGCCGTDATHLEAIAKRLKYYLR